MKGKPPAVPVDAKLPVALMLVLNAGKQLQDLQEAAEPARPAQAKRALKAAELASGALEDLRPELRKLARRKP